VPIKCRRVQGHDKLRLMISTPLSASDLRPRGDVSLRAISAPQPPHRGPDTFHFLPKHDKQPFYVIEGRCGFSQRVREGSPRVPTRTQTGLRAVPPAQVPETLAASTSPHPTSFGDMDDNDMEDISLKL
jgi:hypothetical protein